MSMTGSQANPYHEPRHTDLTLIYRQHSRSLVRLAAVALADRQQAEDVVQEVFASLSKRRAKQWDDPDHAIRYLRRATLNCCRNFRRAAHRESRRTNALAQAIALSSDSQSTTDTFNFAVQAVRSAVASLPYRQREVASLRLLLDLSFHDIALTLDISDTAVKSAYSRSMEKLRELLGDLR